MYKHLILVIVFGLMCALSAPYEKNEVDAEAPSEEGEFDPLANIETTFLYDNFREGWNILDSDMQHCKCPSPTSPKTFPTVPENSPTHANGNTWNLVVRALADNVKEQLEGCGCGQGLGHIEPVLVESGKEEELLTMRFAHEKIEYMHHVLHAGIMDCCNIHNVLPVEQEEAQEIMKPQ
eukprot:PhF_6_TR35797/c0_g1_i1/m.52028